MEDSTRIMLFADADPTFLSRVFGLLAAVNLVPEDCSANLRADGTMEVNLRLRCVSEKTSHFLIRKCQQLPQVIEVSGRPTPGEMEQAV